MGSFVGRDHIARGFPGPVGITIAEADGPRDGIHPIHYSIVIVAAVGIGLFLPPIGGGLFIACSIADLSVDRATRAMLPFVLVLSIGLLIIVLVPWITLVLPRVFTYSDLTGARWTRRSLEQLETLRDQLWAEESQPGDIPTGLCGDPDGQAATASSSNSHTRFPGKFQNPAFSRDRRQASKRVFTAARQPNLTAARAPRHFRRADPCPA